ncbi:cytochrome P450 [Rhodococcus opacus]|uniref:cytochrome P450 n=1 Tax=Rhodococcus opacus TaxID=37919 RepID=UPI00155A4C54|nr:cytochrome P450 [Rhodococcus opacus]
MIDPFPLGSSLTEAEELHEQLRKTGPALPATDPDGHRVWVITRYDDVARLLVNPRIVNVRPDGPEGSPGLKLPPALARNLLNMMPDDHRRVRALATPAFARRRIESVRGIVQHHVDELLDQLDVSSDGTADLMAGLTSPLPARVIAEVLGIDGDAAARFRAAAADMMSIDPSHPASNTVRVPAMTTIVMVLLEVIADKRANPADDVISEWIAARDVEDRLTEEELTSLAFLVFLAGFENSVYQIANAIGVLSERDRAEVLVDIDDDARWRNLVQQLILDAAPGSFAIRRFNLDELVVGSQVIPAGSSLYLSLRAATADPARGNRRDLAFGRGPHYCLGADLAVMQLDITVRSVFRRYPRMQLVTPLDSLEPRRSWRTHGPQRLPVSLG